MSRSPQSTSPLQKQLKPHLKNSKNAYQSNAESEMNSNQFRYGNQGQQNYPQYQNQNSNSHSDYELVIEFQLRREREKNRILEERLHNKELFIHQMKQYQQQLTLAFEKCQEELINVRKGTQNFSRVQRDYLEEIADLKHLIIRLEDEITIRDKEVQRRHFSSVKIQQPASPTLNIRQKRSKTLMNQEEQSPARLKDPIEDQLIKQSKKITKFLKQFLMMTQCFTNDVREGSLKNRLKIAWRWIKQAIKEWNELKNLKNQLEQFINEASKRLKCSPKFQSRSQFFKIILKTLK